MTDQTPVDAPNRAARRAAGRRTRRLAALGSGAVLATGMASGAIAAFAPAAGAATIAVTNTDDAGAGSLRDALANANAGDTIDLTGLSGTITLTTGQLVIEDAVTITGPGAAVLSISGNNASRVFQMNSDLSGGTVTISGVTITGGFESAQGAGINFYCDDGSANLVVDSVVITGNTADDLGAGLYFDRCHGDNDLTIRNSTISNNQSVGSGGGGIWFDEGNTLTIQNSTIADNHSAYYGGGLYFDDGVNLVVLNSTFSGNAASQGEELEGSGGAIHVTDLTGQATIANSTFTGNSALVNGGAIHVETGNLTIDQATISGNTAGGSGDGLYLGYGEDALARAQRARHGKQGEDADGPGAQAVGTVAITGSIIAGNADGTDDVAAGSESGDTATITASVIGTVNNVTVVDGGGNQNGVADPGLDPLANNGGGTATMALHAGSPAIDTGPNPVPDFAGNEFDQRGPGFARVVGAQVDVGAFEVQDVTPAPLVITPRFTG